MRLPYGYGHLPPANVRQVASVEAPGTISHAFSRGVIDEALRWLDKSTAPLSTSDYTDTANSSGDSYFSGTMLTKADTILVCDGTPAHFTTCTRTRDADPVRSTQTTPTCDPTSARSSANIARSCSPKTGRGVSSSLALANPTLSSRQSDCNPLLKSFEPICPRLDFRDAMMPRMSGPEFLAAVRSSPTELSMCPFVLVSAKTSDEEKVSALLVRLL